MKHSKEILTAVIFGIAVSLLLYAASQTVAYHPFLRIQNAIDDSHFIRRFMLRGADGHETDRIIIVDIDDRSIHARGIFKKWPRRLFAEVIGNLKRDGAELVFLDVILMEGGFKHDNMALADSVRKAGNVFSGYYFNLDAPSIRQRPLDPVLNEHMFSGVLDPESVTRNHFIKAQQMVLPYKALLKSVGGLGFTNYVPDPDGVLRHIPLYVMYGKNLYPSASLQMWLYLKGLNSKQARITSDGIHFGDTVIPTDRHCFLRLNYTGSVSAFKTISFIDVLENNFESGTFNGKVVMIGSGSEELNDLKRIPGHSSLPGVQVHAAALTTLLSGRYLRVTSGNIIFVITVMCGVLSSLLFWFAPPLKVGLPVVICVPLGLFACAVYCFIAHSQLVNISMPSLVVVLLYFVITIYRLVEEYDGGKGTDNCEDI